MKRSLWSKQWILSGIFLLAGVTAGAQQVLHRYEAGLDPVKTNGFYKLLIRPEITARSASGWRDLRLLDERAKQVPYLLDNGLSTEIETITFPLVKAGFDTTRQYYIVLDNARQYYVDNLRLQIEHTDAIRALTLAGSDDQVNWYAVREDFYWEQSNSSERRITFPQVHYRYLKISFKGRGELPVRVLQAATYAPHSSAAYFFDIAAPVVTQKDSGRYSYVTATFDRRYKIDKLELDISGPRYFHRSADISDGAEHNDVNADFLAELSSGIQAVPVSLLTDRVQITIRNDDNQPIHVSKVKAAQDAQFLVAYLESGHTYKLTFGDTTAKQPVYDLTYFKDSIGKNIPVLNTGPIRELQPGAAPPVEAPADNRWLMWIVIAIVLAGLLFMTTRMLKQVKKED